MEAAGVVALVLIALAPAGRLGGEAAAPWLGVVSLAAVLAAWVRSWAVSAKRGSVHDRKDPARVAWNVAALAALVSLAAGSHRWAALQPVVTILAAGAVHWLVANGTVSKSALAQWVVPALLVGLAAGMPADRNAWAVTTGMGLPLAFGAVLARGRPAARWVGAAALAALLAGLALHPARGALFAGCAGLAAALSVRPMGRLAAVALLLTGGALAWPRGADAPRVDVARSALEMAADRPVAGHGAGSFRAEFPPYREPRPALAGYEEVADAGVGVLQVAAEQGALGALAWLLLAYVVLRRWAFFAQRQEEPGAAALLAGLGGAFAGFLAAALVGVPWASPAHVVALGLVTGTIEYAGNRRPLASSYPAREASMAAYGSLTLVLLFAGLVSARAAGAAVFVRAAQRETDAAEREALLEGALEWNWRDAGAQESLGLLRLDAGRPIDAEPFLAAALAENPHRLVSLLALRRCVEEAPGSGLAEKYPDLQERIRRIVDLDNGGDAP